jgi:hypothetical protein
MDNFALPILVVNLKKPSAAFGGEINGSAGPSFKIINRDLTTLESPNNETIGNRWPELLKKI